MFYEWLCEVIGAGYPNQGLTNSLRQTLAHRPKTNNDSDSPRLIAIHRDFY